ncbi:MAG: GntR family transcriptional regulator [Anaerolineae bacterium]|nr:GntR family transcriptional regulator [Anaerolineae bacterium]
MQLDKQHPVPIYLQLKNMLQNQIMQGMYYSHQKLPSERDLCRDHNLSRMTARRALQELIDEGYAYTKTGKGTFVSDTLSGIGNHSAISQRKVSGLVDLASLEYYQKKLMDRLVSFDPVGVEKVTNEVLATNSVETVATSIFPAVIRELEDRWHRQQISLLTQNYAVTTLRCQLTAMINATGSWGGGIKALLACAPDDQHEIGILSLALALRRRGLIVIYLGPNVSTTEFRQVFDMVQPQLVCFSAATEQSAKKLTDFRQANKGYFDSRSLFTYGGVAFSRNQSLISDILGLYLGHTIEAAVLKVEHLFKGIKIS